MLARTALVVVGLMAMGALGAEEEAPANFKDSCYVCTSAANPDCAESEAGKLENFKKKCSSDLPKGEGFDRSSKPVGCRKILQEVSANGVTENRIVRQCAFSGENEDGFKRTGNEGVRLWYYQCDSENFCNGAVSASAASALGLAAIALLALLR